MNENPHRVRARTSATPLLTSGSCYDLVRVRELERALLRMGLPRFDGRRIGRRGGLTFGS